MSTESKGPTMTWLKKWWVHLAFLALAGLSPLVCIQIYRLVTKRPETPPPGYRILCDHKGHYVVESTEYYYFYPTVYSSRKTAIFIAWDKYQQDLGRVGRSEQLRREQENLRARFTECNDMEKR